MAWSAEAETRAEAVEGSNTKYPSKDRLMKTFDKPAHRPTVPEIQELVDAYYQFPQCEVGGDLHIVLDDGNVEDTHIQWCIENAGVYRDFEPECARLLGRLLLLMTMTQRRKIDADYHGKPMTQEVFIARCNELLDKYKETT